MSQSGYIVTGTDTGVGKTVFAAALAHALDASYYKPIQAGIGDVTDRDRVAELSGLPAGRLVDEAYRLAMPASPHLAAEAENRQIDTDRLRHLPEASPLVVEGAGGVLVPVTRTILQIDLFRAWELPVIVCARTTLGTINHTLLTLEALASRAIRVHGVAFIGEPCPDVELTIAQFSGVRRLGRLAYLDPLTPAALHGAFARSFDVEALRASCLPGTVMSA